ncbi:FmdB family transcriptional regulator [Sorangium cellulosum]|uniref:FmdB family transcriptional regulator n=1 Tax=Sorangium cellulosum TaxID=56 RepID=A0A2L0ENH6_SORCE|nr:zinc ribbon domain-containing protein [Sorangium cellulosum]AUX40849.1 FmdB family transcriptional regulator [Sorangium cellulosum]
MPTYEYACTSCAHEWEAEQSIKEAPLSECPSCGNATARRQISRGTGFILKGGGWYSDLYASGSNKPPAKSDSGSGSGGSEGKGSADSGSTSSGSSSPAGGSTKSDAGASSTTAAA